MEPPRGIDDHHPRAVQTGGAPVGRDAQLGAQDRRDAQASQMVQEPQAGFAFDDRVPDGDHRPGPTPVDGLQGRGQPCEFARHLEGGVHEHQTAPLGRRHQGLGRLIAVPEMDRHLAIPGKLRPQCEMVRRVPLAQDQAITRPHQATGEVR